MLYYKINNIIILPILIQIILKSILLLIFFQAKKSHF